MTNEEFTKLCMADVDDWMDVECDGCGAVLGGCLISEYPDQELVLCSNCDYTCCSYVTLERVDPIKYADEIAKQKADIYGDAHSATAYEKEKNEKCAKYREIQCCADCTADPCPLDSTGVAVRIIEDTNEIIPF